MIKISLKFVPKSPIDKKPSLAQIMAWRRIGDKPLSEPMLTQFTDAYMRGWGWGGGGVGVGVGVGVGWGWGVGGVWGGGGGGVGGGGVGVGGGGGMS